MVGYTGGGHYTFWPAQNEWHCYSGGIENWPQNLFKNKQRNKRMRDNGAKGEKKNVENWKIDYQRYFKCSCAGDIWNQVFYLQLASFSLLLNDLLAVQWTFGS